MSPTDLQSMNVSMTSVDVYWTVPYITYTPEQYIVYYGTSQSSLISSSALVNGSTNLTAEYIQYSVTLMGLESDTLYYYRMGSSNTEGATNSTNIGNFTTLRIEGTNYIKLPNKNVIKMCTYCSVHTLKLIIVLLSNPPAVLFVTCEDV